jgi:hypothetical protein
LLVAGSHAPVFTAKIKPLLLLIQIFPGRQLIDCGEKGIDIKISLKVKQKQIQILENISNHFN